MRGLLTPARWRGVEILDDPKTPSDVRERSMADVARSNVLFGGRRAVLRTMGARFAELPRHASLVDVGTGTADIAEAARSEAERHGVTLTAIGIDVSETLLRRARRRLDAAVVADAACLPLAPASVDVVVCSQLLHHFDDRDVARVIAELHRVARGCVVIADLRRSWIAAAGFWIAASLLRFHPVTRHDGVVSVFRGFTARELERAVFEATGVTPRVRTGPFFRVVASWTKPQTGYVGR